MSTDYYDLKEPWGKLAVEASTDRYRLTLWDQHGSEAGSLTLRPEDGPGAMLHFFGDEPVCQTSNRRRGRDEILGAVARIRQLRVHEETREWLGPIHVDVVGFREHDIGDEVVVALEAKTIPWATKAPKGSKHEYTFNYQEMKTENGGKQMKTVWRLPAASRNMPPGSSGPSGMLGIILRSGRHRSRDGRPPKAPICRG